MSIAKIHQILFATETKIYTRRSLFWLGLGLAFSIAYSLIGLKKAFDGDYLVQDDARQHVFWMSRFLDPQLFPNDLIADYYQSIAPWGYKNIYRLAALLGIDPLVFNKFVPGILGILTTIACFIVSLQLLPLPLGAFVATLLFNQNLWIQGEIISGTARDFVYPLFLGFIYYWQQRSLWGVCLMLLLIAWFYPSLVLICAGVLFWQLWRFDGYLPRLCRDPKIYFFSCVGLGVAWLVLLPYVLANSEYGPTTTLAQARNLPEFLAGGRASFFHDDDPWQFWFNASRTGIKLPSALIPQLAYGGLLLPLLLKFPQLFPLSKQINPQITQLRDLLIVAFGWFFVAHALLFRLYLPSRYTTHSLKVTIILAASITWLLVIDAIFRWAIHCQPQSRIKSLFAVSILVVYLTYLVGFPATLSNFVNTGYQQGEHPQLYQFLQQQPKDTLVASLTSEADLIPSFAQRSILVGREYAIPYHMGYYQPFRQRVVDLIEAQYTPEMATVTNFIDRYGIDLWLLEISSFTPEYLANNRWLRDHSPTTQKALANLRQGNLPAIASLLDSCMVFQDSPYVLLAADCLKKASWK